MKVLIAIDSSPASHRVLEEIAARPWPSNTAFCIVSAVEVGRFSEVPALIADAKRESEQLVKAGAAKLLCAKQTATTQVLMGSPRRAVSAYAQDWSADLIVAGSHGHSTVGRFFLGSVAQGILRTASCSVEIVRYPAGGRAPSSHPMKILLATDGSECSVAAERSVASRPWPIGTVFKILSVEELVPTPIPVEVSSLAAIYPASLLEELVTGARARAIAASEGAQKTLTQAGLTVLGQDPTPSGDPKSVILDTAKTWQADLIVLGSHGRHGLDRFLMGSVAESVAVHAHCSVVVVR
ncbi:MAG TPA: universal stress protein [Candidatus Eisenbacteria bacterium]|jgi:nucleotide-binding universal stress UspA family protein|nr:universal stress protein [Candidatus Eisenbacteria bacterium]